MLRISISFSCLLMAGTAQAAPLENFPRGMCVNAVDIDTLSARYAEQELRSLSAAGVTTIRIPLHIDNKVATQAPYTFDETYLDKIASLAQAAANLSLSIILDFHDVHWLRQRPIEEHDRFVAAWSQAANRWKSLPDSVLFDALNEPSAPISGEIYLTTIEDTVKTIRRYDPTRRILVESPKSGQYYYLHNVPFLSDSAVIPEFHFYEPMSFTHQGASWIKRYRYERQTYNVAEVKAHLAKAVKRVTSFIAEGKKVPVLGEFGVINEVPADERVKYLALVAKSFGEIGVQSCVWSWSTKSDVFSVNQDSDFMAGFRTAIQERKN